MVSATEKHQITTFQDGETEWQATATPSSDPTRTTTIQETDSLSEFFSRPIQLGAYAWSPGVAFPLTRLAPWELFFTNPRIANRLSNYALINCTLKVKLQVNGNGFYFGRLMADWHPYFSTDPLTSSADDFLASINASQRIKVFIDPTDSQGAVLHIPFLYTRNSMSVTDPDWAILGSVIIRSLVTLQHANASTVPITISVFAWAEDVVVSLPTTVNAYGLTAQANESDESETVKISSTVAAAAGALSTVPAIAPFAMATSMVATGVGQAARLFGFSKPANLAEPKPILPRYTSALATTDSGDASHKLTVTSKAELTIDPRVVGVDVGDELVIADIAGRETLYDSFAWASTTPTGSLLRNYRVTPVDARSSAGVFQFPACAFAARPFQWWRGTMRYRVVIVASAFHKGRLRFVWDPVYIANAGATELNLAYTHIVDLEGKRDFVVDIPWGSADPFLPVPAAPVADYASSTRYNSGADFGAPGAYCNGVFAVYVQNSLTVANDLPSSVSILVFKSCPDMCVAAPQDGFGEYVTAYSATPQAKEVDMSETTPESCEPISTAPPQELGDGQCDERQMQVFFGEAITSFRSLLKRFVLHSCYARAGTILATQMWVIAGITDFPAYKGYTTLPMHYTDTGKKINYVQSTLLHYLAPAFFAVRGSTRSKYIASTNVPNNITVLRATRTFNESKAQTVTTLTTTTPSTAARAMLVTLTPGYGGSAITPAERQPVLEVEHPYYKAARFDLCKDINLSFAALTRGGLGLGSCTHQLSMIESGNASVRTISRYVAVGEDFNLILFQGCPPMVAFPKATMPTAAIT